MNGYESFVTGKFISEAKSRFLCNVNINGTTELCYVPSSCKLSKLMDLGTNEVLLVPTQSSKSKTRYSLYAVKVGRKYTIVNLSEANRAVENSLYRRTFFYLGDRSTVRRETYIEGYKTDLYIEATKTIVEIKTIINENPKAFFPSVDSSREIRQFEKLSELLDNGYKVCLILVSMTGRTEEVIINSEFGEVYAGVIDCISKGMLIKAHNLRLTQNGLKITSPIRIQI